MHDAHELAVFFSEADTPYKTVVLLEVCKREPDLLLSILRDMTLEPWKQECLALLNGGTTPAGRTGKIEAIKRCRELTGWNLKEAKDAVEAL